VRLDHLLSKEHLATPARHVIGVVPARGAKSGSSRLIAGYSADAHPKAVWGQREPRAGAKSVRRARCSVLRVRALGARRGPETGPFSAAHLENLIASASIWAKLVRAHGGCLGARSRGRTREAAKSPGEPPTRLRSGGIRMGKPGRGHALSPRSEHIGPGRELPELKHLSRARKGKQPRLPQ
jgi:hypothetical protein